MEILIPLILSIIAAFPLALISLILAATNRSKINRLSKENDTLRARLNAEFGQKQGFAPAPKQPIPTSAPTPPPVTTPVPTPTAATQPTPTPTPAPSLTPAPSRAATTVTTITKTQPAVSQNNPVKDPQKPEKNLENLFGKNVLAIAATALIFVGLIAFGVLVFTKITDTVKILGMFLASFAITGAGIFLTKKNRNAFTETLSGCGVGAVYISILVTHLYFDRLSDLAAFGLILLWGVGLFLLSRWLKIRSLVYIAHFGCILSSVLSVGYGQVTEKYVEITLYQLVTFTLLFLANRKEKILHTLSCYASIILNTALCLIMTDAFGGTLYGSATTAVFGILCLALNGFNAAIYVLTLRRPSFDAMLHSVCTNGIYFFALLLGGFVCGQSYFQGLTGNLFPTEPPEVLQTTTYALNLLVIFAILALTGAVIYVYTNRMVKIHALITGQLLLAALLISAAVDLNHLYQTLPLTVLFALLSGIVSLILKKKGDKPMADLLWGFGLFFLLIDAILTCFFLPEFEFFGVFYSLILIALSFFYLKIKTGTLWGFPFFQMLLISLHFSFTACTFAEDLTGEIWLGLILATIGNIALYLIYKLFVKTPDTVQKTSEILMEIGESAWIFAMSLIVIQEQEPLFAGNETPYTGYFLVLSALILIQGLMKIPSVIARKNSFMTVWYAIKFTYLTLVPIGQFTELFEEQFILSVFFMIIAALCILFGFVKNLKPVRVYGLVLTLTSVLKMVIVDVWNQESLTRVISLIAGGIICFTISAAYSAIEKQQTKKQLEKETNNA